MQANQTAMRLHSDEFEELMQFCNNLVRPYTEHDISAFKAIYRCIYGGLTREERNCAERLVALIGARLETPEPNQAEQGG